MNITTNFQRINKFKVGDKINCYFANLNKNCTLTEYVRECFVVKDYSLDSVKIEKIINLSVKQYKTFIKNLMCDKSGVLVGIGEGGTGSDYQLPQNLENEPYYRWPEIELKKWAKLSYRLGTLVICDNHLPFIVDAQGYKYARYVGFFNEEFKQ